MLYNIIINPMEFTTVTYKGVQLDVTGEHIKGGFGGYDEAPYPADFIIDVISVCDCDITNLIDDDEKTEISKLILETL